MIIMYDVNNHSSPLHLPRLLGSAVCEALSRSPVVIVTGARTTGKTTLVTMPPVAEGRAYRSLDDYHSPEAAELAAEGVVEEGCPLYRYGDCGAHGRDSRSC